LNEQMNVFQPDVVGINIVRKLPHCLPDRGIRCAAGIPGRGANDRVFAIGFIPDGGQINPDLPSQHKGLQLCHSLVAKSIANPDRVLS
jgi:hypothetical protein